MDSFQLQILTGYIFDNIIANYLDIKDIYNLSLVNRSLYHKINENYILTHIKTRIINNLKNIFEDDYNSFVLAINRAKAIISGSFIIQSILNEKWHESDIDIYVEYDKNNKYAGILEEFLGSKTNDYVDGYYHRFDDIHSTRNYYFKKNYTIQLVKIYTTINCCRNCMQNLTCINDIKCTGKKSQTLWDHVNNTGFEACKNMIYFNDDLNLEAKLKEYKQIINKCTVFTILDTEDFLFRINKYSRRGFFFKPKYNKLLCLEYLWRKLYNLQIKKTNNLKHSCISAQCLLKLFYRNINHYHHHDNGYIYIHQNNNILDKLFFPSDLATKQLILKCINLDAYAAIRNKLAEDNNAPKINIYNTKNLKYDMQYGLPIIPYNYNQAIKPEVYVDKIEKLENNKKLKKISNDWTIVKYKKHPNNHNKKPKLNKQPNKPLPKQSPKQSPIPIPNTIQNTTITWADHLKNLKNKK